MNVKCELCWDTGTKILDYYDGDIMGYSQPCDCNTCKMRAIHDTCDHKKVEVEYKRKGRGWSKRWFCCNCKQEMIPLETNEAVYIVKGSYRTIGIRSENEQTFEYLVIAGGYKDASDTVRKIIKERHRSDTHIKVVIELKISPESIRVTDEHYIDAFQSKDKNSEEKKYED